MKTILVVDDEPKIVQLVCDYLERAGFSVQTAADGKTLGAGGGLSNETRPLVKPRWQFKPGGKCGTPVSDLFPHIREKMDDVCLIRSMTSDNNEHFQATLEPVQIPGAVLRLQGFQPLAGRS